MRKIFCVLGYVVMLSSMGCASQQSLSDLLKDVQAAIDGSGNAKECATQTYELAVMTLEQAKKAKAAGDEDIARKKAQLAQTLAKQAREEALANAADCERRRNAANAVTQKLEEHDDFKNIPTFVQDDTFRTIYFDFDESVLTGQALQDLQSNVKILKNRPELRVYLNAHTDERGTTEYNLALSQRRGESVKSHAQSMGVEGSRMVVIPYGKEKPASFGTREQDYALNRRVEFVSR